MASLKLELKKNKTASRKFTIRNGGGGILSGSIGCETIKKKNWLKIPPGLCNFTITSGKRQDIEFEVDTHGLPSGFKDDGTIKITSNVDTQVINVNLLVAKSRSNIVPIVLVPLLLIVGIVFSVYQHHKQAIPRNPSILTASPFSVINHLMTGITKEEFNNAYNGCATPPQKHTFLDTDKHATQWFYYHNATPGDTIIHEWYSPNGYLHKKEELTIAYPDGCCHLDLDINGYLDSSKLGQWKVMVYLNRQLLFSDAFMISKPPPPPVQFSVTNHLMTGITNEEFSNAYNGCATPPPKYTFFDTDKHATQWFYYQNATPGDAITWKWYTPGEFMHYEDKGVVDTVEGCWQSHLNISGNYASSNHGQWQVKVYRNEDLLFSETFTISKPPPALAQFSVVKHLMTGISKDEFHGKYSGCVTPPQKDSFLETDLSATQWFYYQNATPGDAITWEWYAPGEHLYYKDKCIVDTVEGCWQSYLGISGRYASSKTGQWQVKVYRNGQLLFSDTFTIGNRSVDALQIANELSFCCTGKTSLEKGVVSGEFEHNECIMCHTVQTPDIVKRWKKSKHASSQKGIVGCDTCHGNNHLQLNVLTWRNCIQCHTEQFAKGYFERYPSGSGQDVFVFSEWQEYWNDVQGYDRYRITGTKGNINIEKLTGYGEIDNIWFVQNTFTFTQHISTERVIKYSLRLQQDGNWMIGTVKTPEKTWDVKWERVR